MYNIYIYTLLKIFSHNSEINYVSTVTHPAEKKIKLLLVNNKNCNKTVFITKS